MVNLPKTILRLRFPLSALCVAACTDQVVAEEISIATYNVENLFDSKHDDGHDDFTYLPWTQKNGLSFELNCKKLPVPVWAEQCLRLDWNDRLIDLKEKRLASVLTGNGQRKAPDIVVLQEVENSAVLKNWVNSHLADQGYREAILIEGVDYRGIDVAILSRFLLVEPPKLLPVPSVRFGKTRFAPTRGILQATFSIDDRTILTAFAVHLPSAAKPWTLRKQALNFLTQTAQNLPRNRIVVAAGDFNNTSSEEAQFGLFRKYAAASWHISHFVGCRTCAGTHFHVPTLSWSFLDAILVLKQSQSGWQMDDRSVHIIQDGKDQVDSHGRPIRFSADGKNGVSDHLPVAATLKRTNRNQVHWKRFP